MRKIITKVLINHGSHNCIELETKLASASIAGGEAERVSPIIAKMKCLELIKHLIPLIHL